MPSLRRTLSTPSVRISPYPSLASRSQRPHRRSSGSDLSARKVLGDIDWWHVADGQREKNEEEEGVEGEGDEEGDEATSVPVVDAPTVADHSENAIERPSTPDVGVRTFGLNSPQRPIATTPRTPSRRTVSGSSASSSLESTPEVLRTPPLERLSFGDMGFADPGPLFHIRLASLGALPFVPKYIAPEIGDQDEDPILADGALICHDDLFA
ncbi:hypothetical protein EDB89DRAFT_1900386 [Lactarius sanguifluus]|nr:hypothetical protein EDB89DRAFT_1900386 [Lactarius sanguifluus]